MPIGQNRDARIPIISFNEPVLLMGRFLGNATGNVIPVAGTTKGGLTVVRTGTGAHTITVPTPVGVVQSFCCWLNQPTGTVSPNTKTVYSNSVANNVTSIPIQVALASNSSANDLTATEELCVEIWMATSSTP